MNNKFKTKFIHFFTIKKDVLILAITSFFIIVLNEFFLKYLELNNKFFTDFLQIIVKLSYSYFSAFLFYFIIVHLPKERKKIKAYHFINSKIGLLSDEIGVMLSKILIDPKESLNNIKKDINREDFLMLCQINDNLNLISIDNKIYRNKSEYAFYVIKEIYTKSHELLLYGDIIENDIFIALIDLNYFCNAFISSYSSHKFEKNPLDGENLRSTIGFDLYKLYVMNNSLNASRNNFARKYWFNKPDLKQNK